jgi:mono/diheme cytochrome c family protein
MKKASVLIGLMLAAVGLGAGYRAQDVPDMQHNVVVPPDVSRRVNPVKPTEESMVRIRKTYKIDCAMCHASDGSGKSELAEAQKFKMKNFRNAEQMRGRTDGDLFYIIRNGFGDMPPEGVDRAKDEDIWHMVWLIRSFADPSVLQGKH